MTRREAEKAVADLNALLMILAAFPAETAQERRNLREWTRAVDLGIEALRAHAGPAQ